METQVRVTSPWFQTAAKYLGFIKSDYTLKPKSAFKDGTEDKEIVQIRYDHHKGKVVSIINLVMWESS